MKSLIPCGIIIATLALSGSAMAADAPAKPAAAAIHTAHARVVPHRHYARVVKRGTAQRRYVSEDRPFDLGGILQSFFGGNFAVQVPAHASRGGSYDWSPSYDNSTTTVDTSSAATDAQAVSDDENQAIQQMNDTNALNASMAAAEQENDAANAATLQTEINAGM